MHQQLRFLCKAGVGEQVVKILSESQKEVICRALMEIIVAYFATRKGCDR